MIKVSIGCYWYLGVVVYVDWREDFYMKEYLS